MKGPVFIDPVDEKPVFIELFFSNDLTYFDPRLVLQQPRIETGINKKVDPEDAEHGKADQRGYRYPIFDQRQNNEYNSQHAGKNQDLVRRRKRNI